MSHQELRLSEVEDRRDLIRVMDSSMMPSAESMRERGKYAARRNPVKSFLIESNVDIEYLRELNNPVDMKMKPTKDPSLHYIKMKTKPKRGKERTGRYVVEIIDERYWVFHTIERSNLVSAQMKYLVEAGMSGLDYFWFSERLLREFANKGRMKEFSAGIDSKLPSDVEDFIGHMSVRVWGRESKYALGALKEAKKVGRSTSLRAVTSRFSWDEDKGGMYIDERLTSFGKLTSLGTSASMHMNIIDELVASYDKKLKKVEGKIGNEQVSALDIHPFVMSPKDGEIENVKSLVERLVQNMPKMRVVGFPIRVSENFYRIPSTDLHNGDKFDLEVYPKGIRMIFWPESCGNSVLRLETNIQYHLRADLIRGD